MLGMPIEQITPFATFLGFALLGLLSILGIKWGERKQVPGQTMELTGALVDSSSVKMLTAAIEGHTTELIANRQSAEKSRQALYRLIEIAGESSGEVEELRRAVADLANQIARMK